MTDRMSVAEALNRLREIEAALAELPAIRAALETTMRGAGGEAPARPVPTIAPTERAEPEWTNLAKAAAFSGVSEETMAQRAAKFGLGHKIGRSWSIDMARVRAHRENRSYEPIAQA